MMRADDVITIMTTLAAAGVDVWLDGGWGVDALLGEQTRAHDDLDLVIALEQASLSQRALTALGFALAEDELPTRFVMRDAADRRIDFHTVRFDSDGGGIQQLQDGRAYRYPPEGFTACGWIAGHMMPCLTPEVQVRCHQGYQPDANDLHDVLLLCSRFAIAVPALYQRHIPGTTSASV